MQRFYCTWIIKPVMLPNHKLAPLKIAERLQANLKLNVDIYFKKIYVRKQANGTAIHGRFYCKRP